jgi:angio-associated migratory cell protein
MFDRTYLQDYILSSMEDDNTPNNESAEADVVQMQDEDDDEEPQFLDPNDAVEVVVDDDVPMDDDDDEEEEDALDENVTSSSAPDVSKVQLKSHTGPVYAVAAAVVIDNSSSCDQLVVVSGGGDDRAYLHRITIDSAHVTSTTSSLLSHAHTDTVSAVAFNFSHIAATDAGATAAAPPNKLVAVGGYDGAILLYDAVTGACLKQLEGPTDVEWLCFHKTGTVLLAGSATDGTVWMYHTVLNKCLQVFVGHSAAVTAGGFTPDGKFSVTCSSDGTLRVWAPKTGQAKHTIKFNNNDAGLTCLAFEAHAEASTINSKLVMVGAEDGQVHVCHTGTGKVVHNLRHYELPTVNSTASESDDDEVELPMSVEAVGFCPCNPVWCASGGVDGVLKIWDLTAGQLRQVCRVTDGDTPVQEGITRLTWHNTLPVVFTATTTGTVRLWDARNGALIHTLSTGATSSTINDMQVQFLAENKAVIITASDDNVVRIFDVDVPCLLQHRQ